ncbi:MAG: hypothetical protein QOK16_4005 [Solirubrobacteraceae bacterium]|jgi:hypothetical protein|nr:hypothetical protein [Solirubrobacteraceae bacterium]MEA2183744.1 hypothetical protein [Solirubrobacteraceae bacterium]MEA2188994.1 hypothetical protein [Solirubrobacteraceae bacterium]
MPLIHYLLIYNIALGRLVETQEFTDASAAAARYAALEREYAGTGTFEIVLVGADSIDTIKRTHGQYFSDDAGAEASPYLAGV